MNESLSTMALRAGLPQGFGPLAVGLLAIGLAAVIALNAPIAQYPDYHDFADDRAAAGLPNAWNVLSNLPFLYVGLIGIALTRRIATAARRAWTVMFVGVGLVAFGSGYYHWAPTDATLIWDRLPMTIGFMGFLAALLTDYVDRRLERYLLLPALIFGVASVAYWARSDDLSIYVWVQAFPVLCALAVVVLYRIPRVDCWCLSANIGFYALAKVGEILDGELLAWTGGLVSGHSLKHLLAAAGTWMIYRMLKARAGRTQ